MTIVRCGSLVLMTVLAAITAWAQDAATVQDILTKLRAGGHIIVVRHGATHADQADTDPLNLDNVAKQRQLNDKGRADARAFGDVLKQSSVPIGKVYSSRFQRAVETARLIGGKDPEPTNDVTEGGQVVSPNENARRMQALRAMAGRVPEAGTNTLIVTHKPNILDAFGKDWFEVREAETSIFKPDGSGGYALVGRVQIGQWAAAK
jgi:broad specificity phosphatase PhoE